MADHHHVSKYKGKNIKYKVEGQEARIKIQIRESETSEFLILCVSPHVISTEVPIKPGTKWRDPKLPEFEISPLRFLRSLRSK